MVSALKSIGVTLRLVFRADWLRTILSFVLIALQGLAAVLNAYWLKKIVDGVVAGDLSAATRGLVGLILTILAGTWTNFTGVLSSQHLRERVDGLVDEELIELSSGIPYLEHHERAEYLQEMELLRNEKGSLTQTVSSIINNFSTLVQAIAVGLLLGRVHPVLLALPLFAVPSLAFTNRIERIRQKAHEESVEISRGADHLFELATTPDPAKELRIFGLQEEVPNRHVRLWAQLDRLRRRAAIKGAALGGFGWLTFALGFAGAIVLVVVRAVDGKATAGDVILAVQLTGQVNQQVASAVTGVAQLIRGLKTVRRYEWLLGYAQQMDRQARVDAPAPVPTKLVQGIDLQAVSFTYPGTETEALKDVTLSLPAGSTVALVGENGAGKTTLVKLLSRFYEPTSGLITVEGVDLRRFDLESWRQRTAAGFQDFVEFEFLARQTVGAGDLPRIDEDPAVERALVRAGASDVLDSLPKGLGTQLGKTFEEGTDLSGGQWQKLALGRAMMRDDPLLLILDEPTASLDAETEHALFEGYAAASRRAANQTGSITILVSHRFSTVRMADLIVVIDGGRVVESGRHEELVRNGGLYAELYQLQARRYR